LVIPSESIFQVLEKIVTVQYVERIKIECGISKVWCFLMDDHLGPFFVSASLLKGIVLKWTAKKLPLPDRPIYHDAAKIAAMREKRLDPS